MIRCQSSVTGPHVQAIYSRAHSLGSLAIRSASWFEQWSHVGLLTGFGTLVEATAWHGVVETDLDAFKAKASRYEIVDIACPHPESAIHFARAQVGKGYDWGSIWGFISRDFEWEDDRAWVCTELLEASLVAGGRRRFRAEAHRITPRQSYIAY